MFQFTLHHSSLIFIAYLSQVDRDSSYRNKWRDTRGQSPFFHLVVVHFQPCNRVPLTKTSRNKMWHLIHNNPSNRTKCKGIPLTCLKKKLSFSELPTYHASVGRVTNFVATFNSVLVERLRIVVPTSFVPRTWTLRTWTWIKVRVWVKCDNKVGISVTKLSSITDLILILGQWEVSRPCVKLFMSRVIYKCSKLLLKLQNKLSKIAKQVHWQLKQRWVQHWHRNTFFITDQLCFG